MLKHEHHSKTSGAEHLFDVRSSGRWQVSVFTELSFALGVFLRQDVTAVSATVLDLSILGQFEALGRTAVCFFLRHGLSLNSLDCVLVTNNTSDIKHNNKG